MNLSNTSRNSTRAASAALFATVVLSSALSSAQTLQPLADFPKQSITIVSPFPPGGGNDKISRLLAAELATIVGQPVVVENRGGAGGNLGTTSAANSYFTDEHHRCEPCALPKRWLRAPKGL